MSAALTSCSSLLRSFQGAALQYFSAPSHLYSQRRLPSSLAVKRLVWTPLVTGSMPVQAIIWRPSISVSLLILHCPLIFMKSQWDLKSPSEFTSNPPWNILHSSLHRLSHGSAALPWRSCSPPAHATLVGSRGTINHHR